MTVTLGKTSFSGGELSPSLFGMLDLGKVATGCSVLRNMFVSLRGGVHSRGGFAYAGRSLQTGSTPPRIIEFKFSATQQFVLEFSHLKMRIIYRGAYVVEPSKAITAISGNQVTVPGHGYSVGDWFYVNGSNTTADNRTFIISGVSGDNLTVTTVLGIAVSVAGYVSGGTAARIYTVVSPYADVDLPYLKYDQSADEMTICCVNSSTGTEYKPYNLQRLAATNWQFNPITFASPVSAPTNVKATQVYSSIADANWWWDYCVTSVDALGRESVASDSANFLGINIATAAGSNPVTWNAVPGASYYNVYRRPISWAFPVINGSIYGFVGQSLGPAFVDANVNPNFSMSPPTHVNPFARGAILYVSMTAQGTGYSQYTTQVTVNTSTGSGAVLKAVVINGIIIGIVVVNGGENYAPGDTVTITDTVPHGALYSYVDSGGQHVIYGTGGTGASATITVGPQTGTYPSVVAYHQQRRWYGATTNAPDYYWASKPGDYENLDSGIPVNDSDSISGSPWAQQVNGVEWFIPMPGSMILGTAEDVWQLTGGSGSFSPITPSSEQANRQTNFGMQATTRPVTVDWHVLYVQFGGYTVRQLTYNFWSNVFTGVDVSFLSNHLFTGHKVVNWTWSTEPHRTLWAFRDDGKLLSLAYYPDQEITSWSRHDTQGDVVSAATAKEDGYDIVYFVVRRTINGGSWYFVERMDPRQWTSIDDCYCLDAGGVVNLSAPITKLSYLDHLEGQSITVVADGVIYNNLTVTGGSVNVAATNRVTYGLGFTAQVQGLHANVPGGPNIQGKRKRISSATVRVYQSRGFKVGANQPAPSMTSSQADVPWTYLTTPQLPAVQASVGEGSLYSGDVYALVNDNWQSAQGEPSWGALAIQQDLPLPLSVLSYSCDIEVGDDPA